MNLIDQKTLFKATNNMNEISKAMIENIVWMDKSKKTAPSGKNSYDVRVTAISNDGHRRAHVTFSFTKERIAGLMKAMYVKVAIVGDLFLFKAANSEDGWKIYTNKSSRVQMKVSGNAQINEWATKNQGVYRIHYDANSDFYYINATEKGVY